VSSNLVLETVKGRADVMMAAMKEGRSPTLAAVAEERRMLPGWVAVYTA
jgi:hypothetical protein